MLNLRYCDFMKPSGPATIMAPTGLGALDMRIVIDLDAPRRLGQAEDALATPSSSFACDEDSAILRPKASRALVSA